MYSFKICFLFSFLRPVIYRHSKHRAHFIVYVLLFCYTIDASPGWFVQALTDLLDAWGWSPPPPPWQCRETALHNKARFTITELCTEKRACAAIIQTIIERQKNRECICNIKIMCVHALCIYEHCFLCRGIALQNWKSKNDGQTCYSVSIFFLFFSFQNNTELTLCLRRHVHVKD